METVNKSIIIAGSVLIAILLVSIGVYVANSGKGNIEQKVGQASNKMWENIKNDNEETEGNDEFEKPIVVEGSCLKAGPLFTTNSLIPIEQIETVRFINTNTQSPRK